MPWRSRLAIGDRRSIPAQESEDCCVRTACCTPRNDLRPRHHDQNLSPIALPCSSGGSRRWKKSFVPSKHRRTVVSSAYLIRRALKQPQLRSYEHPDDRVLAITPAEYAGLQAAYDHLNVELFEGSLCDVFITYQRRAHFSDGYFSADRFSGRDGQIRPSRAGAQPGSLHRPHRRGRSPQRSHTRMAHALADTQRQAEFARISQQGMGGENESGSGCSRRTPAPSAAKKRASR